MLRCLTASCNPITPPFVLQRHSWDQEMLFDTRHQAHVTPIVAATSTQTLLTNSKPPCFYCIRISGQMRAKGRTSDPFTAVHCPYGSLVMQFIGSSGTEMQNNGLRTQQKSVCKHRCLQCKHRAQDAQPPTALFTPKRSEQSQERIPLLLLKPNGTPHLNFKAWR